MSVFSRSILQILLWRKRICRNAHKQSLRLGVFSGLFQSSAVINYPHFSAGLPFIFFNSKSDCNAVIAFHFYYYLAFTAPSSLNILFIIGLWKKVESLIKQTIKSVLVDWFTNLNWNGERGATEVFLHHIANSLRRMKQVGHFLRTQVTETLHRPQRTNKNIWRCYCQGTNTRLSGSEWQVSPSLACDLLWITFELPTLFLSKVYSKSNMRLNTENHMMFCSEVSLNLSDMGKMPKRRTVCNYWGKQSLQDSKLLFWWRVTCI